MAKKDKTKTPKPKKPIVKADDLVGGHPPPPPPPAGGDGN